MPQPTALSSCPQYSESHPLYSITLATVLKPRPIPISIQIGYSMANRGSLDCMLGVQTHSGPPLFLAPFYKDLARIIGTPQPNQKWLPVLEIETVWISQSPLTIGPFLTLTASLYIYLTWLYGCKALHHLSSQYTGRCKKNIPTFETLPFLQFLLKKFRT